MENGSFIIIDPPANLRQFLLSYRKYDKVLQSLFIHTFCALLYVEGCGPSLYREGDWDRSIVSLSPRLLVCLPHLLSEMVISIEMKLDGMVGTINLQVCNK